MALPAQERELWVKQPVSAIRAIQQQRKQQAEAKKEEVRQYVGQRYRMLLSSADSMISMETLAQSLNDRIHALSDHIANLTTPAKSNLADLSSTKVTSTSNTGAINDQRQSDRDKKHKEWKDHVQFISSAAEKIWDELDQHNYTGALSTYNRAIALGKQDITEVFLSSSPSSSLSSASPDIMGTTMSRLLQIENGNPNSISGGDVKSMSPPLSLEEEAEKWRVFCAQHLTTITQFPGEIRKAVKKRVSTPNLPLQAYTEALTALCLLDNACDITTALEVFLAARLSAISRVQAAVDKALTRNCKEAVAVEVVGEGLERVSAAIQLTVAQTAKLFGNSPDSVYGRVAMVASQKLHPLSSGVLQPKCKEWLSTVTSLISNWLNTATVLPRARSGRALATLRDPLLRLLSFETQAEIEAASSFSTPQAQEPKNPSLKDDASSVEKNKERIFGDLNVTWRQNCDVVFGRTVNLWEEIFLSGFSTCSKQLIERHISIENLKLDLHLIHNHCVHVCSAPTQHAIDTAPFFSTRNTNHNTGYNYNEHYGIFPPEFLAPDRRSRIARLRAQKSLSAPGGKIGSDILYEDSLEKEVVGRGLGGVVEEVVNVACVAFENKLNELTNDVTSLLLIPNHHANETNKSGITSSFFAQHMDIDNPFSSPTPTPVPALPSTTGDPTQKQPVNPKQPQKQQPNASLVVLAPWVRELRSTFKSVRKLMEDLRSLVRTLTAQTIHQHLAKINSTLQRLQATALEASAHTTNEANQEDEDPTSRTNSLQKKKQLTLTTAVTEAAGVARLCTALAQLPALRALLAIEEPSTFDGADKVASGAGGGLEGVIVKSLTNSAQQGYHTWTTFTATSLGEDFQRDLELWVKQAKTYPPPTSKQTAADVAIPAAASPYVHSFLFRLSSSILHVHGHHLTPMLLSWVLSEVCWVALRVLYASLLLDPPSLDGNPPPSTALKPGPTVVGLGENEVVQLVFDVKLLFAIIRLPKSTPTSDAGVRLKQLIAALEAAMDPIHCLSTRPAVNSAMGTCVTNVSFLFAHLTRANPHQVPGYMAASQLALRPGKEKEKKESQDEQPTTRQQHNTFQLFPAIPRITSLPCNLYPPKIRPQVPGSSAAAAPETTVKVPNKTAYSSLTSSATGVLETAAAGLGAGLQQARGATNISLDLNDLKSKTTNFLGKLGF